MKAWYPAFGLIRRNVEIGAENQFLIRDGRHPVHRAQFGRMARYKGQDDALVLIGELVEVAAFGELGRAFNADSVRMQLLHEGSEHPRLVGFGDELGAVIHAQDDDPGRLGLRFNRCSALRRGQCRNQHQKECAPDFHYPPSLRCRAAPSIGRRGLHCR
jgi:hypothetical protein